LNLDRDRKLPDMGNQPPTPSHPTVSPNRGWA
jgi:hypothetical protein